MYIYTLSTDMTWPFVFFNPSLTFIELSYKSLLFLRSCNVALGGVSIYIYIYIYICRHTH